MFDFILQKNRIFILASFLFGVVVFNVHAGTARAYFSDEERSNENVVQAGTLGISLENAGTYSSDLMYPGDTTTTNITVVNTGSLDSQYTVSTALSGSDTIACDYVSMTVTGPHYSFTGSISDLSSSAVPVTDATMNYSFTVSPSAPPSVWGKTCFFKWKYTAWQDDLQDASGGFSSVKEKMGAIHIGKAVVLNEFIADPTGRDNAAMPGGEWVELYNNSGVSFDLSDWALYDDMDPHELRITSSNTNTHSTIIAPHGFLVVFRDGDGDFNLNNKADSVRLATGYPIASHVVVDSYVYDSEKPEGYSYARIPDGVGEWVDPIPTPGGPNSEQNEVPPVPIAPAVVEIVESGSGSSTQDEVDAEIVEPMPETVDTDTDQPAAEGGTTTVDVADLPVSESESSAETVPDVEQETATEPVVEPELVTENEDVVVQVETVEPPVEQKAESSQSE